MVGKGKILPGVLLLAVFLLAYRVLPVRLEQEQVRALAGSLQNKVIVVDGAYGGYGEDGSGTAGKLARWFGSSGAMVLLSGDADPALDYPPAQAAGGMSVVLTMAAQAGPADLLVSVRPGAGWRITYPAAGVNGEQQLAQDIAQEIPLAEGITRPPLEAVSGLPAGVLWVQVQTGPLDSRGEDNLAWAVYAGAARYFSAKPPVVNGKALETLENDLPSTVDSQ
ncbi:MAG TPA: hypothetical protein VMW83_03605 [Spirochaetia bacterium]|nr:hypothetical protein [Spirochaetia bacterium]